MRVPTFPEVGFSVLPDGSWMDFYSNGIADNHPVNSAIRLGLGVAAPAIDGIGFYTDGYDAAIFKNLVVKTP